MQTNRRNLTKEGKRPIPIPLIVVMFIVFFPVGIAMVVIRLKNSPASVRQTGNAMIAIGFFTLPMALVYLYHFITDTLDLPRYQMGILTFIFIAITLSLFWSGFRRRKSGLRYERYCVLTAGQRVVELDSLVPLFSASYDQIVADVQRMIYEGYFRDGARIDFSGRRLLIGEEPAPVPTVTDRVQETRTVVCSGCGARNAVTAGGTAVCEYCGAPLS